MDELGDVSYEFQPLAFETAGAMGVETYIVQTPPTLVATTSSLIYDVLVYSHL